MAALSRVAGIVDAGGGMRVVVTDGSFAAHLQPGERLYVLPRYKVQEPVPWNEVPVLIARVERFVARRERRWRKSS
jgi:hypothetical protein